MSENAMIGMGAASTTSTASTTFYMPFGSSGPIRDGRTTESDVQMNFRCAGTLSNLRVNAATNARTATTVTVNANGSGSALTTTLTASTTGLYTDLTNSLSIAATDKIDTALTTGTGGGNLAVSGLSAQLQSSGQAAVPMMVAGAQTTLSNIKAAFSGTFGAISTNLNMACYSVEASTLSNLQEVVSANGSAGWTSTTINNGSAGNNSVAVGAAATGLFEDTTHTDSVSSGSYFEFTFGTAATSRTINGIGIKYQGGTSNGAPLYSGSNTTFNATQNYQPLCGLNHATSTETQSYFPMAFAATLSKLNIAASSNSNSAGSMNLRGGAAGGTTLNGTVSVAAGTTGRLQDVTNSDSVNAADLMDTTNVSFNGASSVFGSIGIFCVAAGGAAPVFHGLSTLGAGR